MGWLGNTPIGCIAGVRYNASYGFIGLFLVIPDQRGNGYGVELWKHALNHLIDLPCIGLEAALDRVSDYSQWGFKHSSVTTRWQCIGNGDSSFNFITEHIDLEGLMILEDKDIPSNVVQSYDAMREPSPRPHFLADWLNHPAGKVLALVDANGRCHGFGRIRPCLLKEGEGWRIGPLLADTPKLAGLLLIHLLRKHSGVILLDTPGLNPFVKALLDTLGFEKLSNTIRMYKGDQPPINMHDVYGLACLELG